MMPKSYPFTVGYETIFHNGAIEYYEYGNDDLFEDSLILYTCNKREELKIPKKNCYEESIKHVIECCEKDLPTRLGLDDALKSLTVALKIKEQLVE